MQRTLVVLLFALVCAASATVYFQDDFKDAGARPLPSPSSLCLRRHVPLPITEVLEMKASPHVHPHAATRLPARLSPIVLVLCFGPRLTPV